jgi:hypothetical protein
MTTPSTYANVVDRLKRATRMSGARAVCVVEGTDAAYWSLACAEAAPTLRGVVATTSLSTNALHSPFVARAHVCALDAGGVPVAHWGCATHAVAVVADEAAYVSAVNRALRTPTLRGLAIVVYGAAATPPYVSTEGIASSTVQRYMSKASRRSGEPRVDAWIFKWTSKVQRSMRAHHWSASPPGEGSVSRCLRI